MLLEFGINNFLSFNNSSILSMVSSGTKELKHHKIKIENSKKSNFSANKLAALFGANASGKTNILTAIKTMQRLVVNNGIGLSKLRQRRDLPYRPFLLDENNTLKPSSFDVVLFLNNSTYRYAFSFSEDSILYENLSLIDNDEQYTVFERHLLEVEFGEFYKKNTNLRKSAKKFLGEKLLLLTILGELQEEPFQEIFTFFQKIKIESDPDEFIPMIYNLTESDNLKYITKFLQFADTGLFDIIRNENDDVNSFPEEIKKLISKIEKDKIDFEAKQVEVLFKHHAYKHATQEKYTADFNISSESHGTIKFIILLSLMLETIKENGLLIVDEIESGLHPILVEWLINFFTSIENTTAQMIFSSHCPFIFDQNTIRRDELYIVEKDESGSSFILNAAAYSPRGDGNLSKQYLEGRYGGIPIIQKAYMNSYCAEISQELKHKRISNGK